jgi:hypothetical protein
VKTKKKVRPLGWRFGLLPMVLFQCMLSHHLSQWLPSQMRHYFSVDFSAILKMAVIGVM